MQVLLVLDCLFRAKQITTCTVHEVTTAIESYVVGLLMSCLRVFTLVHVCVKLVLSRTIRLPVSYIFS